MEQHYCETPAGFKVRCYGAAFDHCKEDIEGVFWVSNGEYSSQVNFCPFCETKPQLPLIPENGKMSLREFRIWMHLALKDRRKDTS